jgi:hypothetical protein
MASWLQSGTSHVGHRPARFSRLPNTQKQEAGQGQYTWGLVMGLDCCQCLSAIAEFHVECTASKLATQNNPGFHPAMPILPEYSCMKPAPSTAALHEPASHSMLKRNLETTGRQAVFLQWIAKAAFLIKSYSHSRSFCHATLNTPHSFLSSGTAASAGPPHKRIAPPNL